MEWIFYLILFIGFGLGWLFYEVFKVRAGGVVAIPLLVVYTIHNPLLFGIIIGIAIIIFIILQLIFHKFAVYGRRLLYLSSLFSILFTSITFLLMQERFSLLLTIVPGLIAYNFHKENNSPTNMMMSVIVTATYLLIMILLGLLFLI